MNRSQSLLLIQVVLLLISLLSACGHHKTSIEAEGSKDEVKVEVTKPQLNEFTEPFTLSGSIKSLHKTILSSKITGHIVEMKVDEGSEVKAGEMLAKIDDSETKLNIASTQAEEFMLKADQEELKSEFEELKNKVQMLFHDQEKFLSQADLAQTTFERYSKLLEKDVVSKQEYDEAKTALDLANSMVAKSQAEYNLLMAKKLQLEARAKKLGAKMEQNKVSTTDAMVKDMYTQIVSPLNGFVVRKYANVGDIVLPGQPILMVENPEYLYLEVNVEESQALIFKPNAKLKVFIDAYNMMTVGKIRTIVPVSDPNTHTMKVKIDIPPYVSKEKPFPLYSGMYARLVIPMSGKNYFIPRTAIITKGQVTGVFVVDKKNIARFRIIKTGQTVEGFTEIISGLTDDDKVIISAKRGKEDLSISELTEFSDGTKVIVLGE